MKKIENRVYTHKGCTIYRTTTIYANTGEEIYSIWKDGWCIAKRSHRITTLNMCKEFIDEYITWGCKKVYLTD